MQEVVRVSNIDNMEKLKIYLDNSFKKGRYAEITQAIGMHSILIDPQHTMKDQSVLYRGILRMVKERIKISKGKSYGDWYVSFPALLDKLVSSKQVVTSKAAADVIASHCEAYGAYKSMDDFFFQALDDRKLSLDQIVKYIEKTAEIQGT